MPIRTARLLIRPKQIGDGTITSAALAETGEDLHKWMRWAENQEGFTAELTEIRNDSLDWRAFGAVSFVVDKYPSSVPQAFACPFTMCLPR